MGYGHTLRIDLLIVSLRTIWHRRELTYLRWYSRSTRSWTQCQVRIAGIHPYRVGHAVGRGETCVVAVEETISLSVRELRRKWHGRGRDSHRVKFLEGVICSGKADVGEAIELVVTIL